MFDYYIELLKDNFSYNECRMHALQNLGIINSAFIINVDSRLILLISLDELSNNQFYLVILIFISYLLEVTYIYLIFSSIFLYMFFYF